MAFASFERQHSSAPMSEINMVPLIDVMLVLLVMLIITIPVQLHAVNLNLPVAKATPPPIKPEVIRIDIDARNVVSWNGQPLADRADLELRMAAAAQQTPQPEIHLRADQDAAYRHVAQTLADASVAGLKKIGFVSQPTPP